MSRIGKLPISIPEGVDISVTDTNLVKVKGKLGELEQLVDPAIKISIEDGRMALERATESKDHKSKHGLYYAWRCAAGHTSWYVPHERRRRHYPD